MPNSAFPKVGPFLCQGCGEPVLAGTRYGCEQGKGCWHFACITLVEDDELRERLTTHAGSLIPDAPDRDWWQ